MSVIDTSLWIEKYRPKDLSALALSDDNRGLLESWMEAGEIPHILLAGPAGTGKTTIARILTSALDCRVLALNASNERGIDTIRDRVRNFARSRLGERWRIVFMDEADHLTRDAQTSLRNLIEQHATLTRYVFTCNYLHKIIDPLQSRCTLIELSSPPFKERFRILKAILDAEGVEADTQSMVAYAEHFRDLRKMINGAQKSLLSHDGKLIPPQKLQTDGESIVRLIDANDWTGLRALTGDSSFDHGAALRALFWALPDDRPDVANDRLIVGKAVHESGWTPDPVILFLGTCSELIARRT